MHQFSTIVSFRLYADSILTAIHFCALIFAIQRAVEACNSYVATVVTCTDMHTERLTDK